MHCCSLFLVFRLVSEHGNAITVMKAAEMREVQFACEVPHAMRIHNGFPGLPMPWSREPACELSSSLVAWEAHICAIVGIYVPTVHCGDSLVGRCAVQYSPSQDNGGTRNATLLPSTLRCLGSRGIYLDTSRTKEGKRVQVRQGCISSNSIS